MKRTSLFLFLLLAISSIADAQRSVRTAKPARAVVIDPRLAVIRDAPGYFGKTLQRLRRGREVTILGSKPADGVIFLRVTISKRTNGWIQREAVATRAADDEDRLYRLTLGLNGFEQFESARIFLAMFPNSVRRPRMLLLFGDLAESAAAKLSDQANKRLRSAAGAPYYAYLLNYSGLDRYRKLGVTFVVNNSTRRIHYSGDAWAEIVRRFPDSDDAVSARARLAVLEENMNKTS